MSLRLAILKDLQSTPIPISTPDLIAIHAAGKPHPRHQVWAALKELVKAGLAKKVKLEGKYSAFWTSPLAAQLK